MSEQKNTKRCPTCNSPSPELHPAVQWEGEVQICHDDWHLAGLIAAKRKEIEATGLCQWDYRESSHV